MATHTVASAIPSSHLRIANSSDDQFQSRENTVVIQHSNCDSDKPTLQHGAAADESRVPRYQSVHGPGEVAYASLAASAAGMGSIAIARGDGATAAASGDSSHAIIRQGGKAEAAGAVGWRSMAESFNGNAFVTATGTLCCSISHRAACPAVSVGFNPISHAAKAGGTAVTVGEDGMASAGPNGYLVFVDTSAAGGPATRVFAVGEPEIEPNVLYGWRAGMTRPKKIDVKAHPETDWATRKRWMREMDHDRFTEPN